jgi:hypothetical protein
MDIQETNMQNEKQEIDKQDKKTYFKNYCLKNKEEFKKKIKCTLCGGEYTKPNKYRHEHTKRHLNYSLVNKMTDNIDIITKLTNELNAFKLQLLNNTKAPNPLVDVIAKNNKN